MSMFVVVGLGARVAVHGAGVDDREIELRVVGAEVEHEVEDLVDDLVRAGARAVDLVDDDDRLEAVLERLLEHEARLRHRALEGVDDQQAPSAIFRTRSTSPPKSAWPGVSMTLIFTSL